MIVRNDRVAQEARDAAEGIPQNGGANMPDVHGLGDVGRTEVDQDRPGTGRRLIKQMFALEGFAQGRSDRPALQAKIQKARAGDLDPLAPWGDIEFLEDFLGELARIALAFLGQGHEGIALVIAKLRVRARPNLHGGQIRLRQQSGHGGAQFFFDAFVQHRGGNLPVERPATRTSVRRRRKAPSRRRQTWDG